MYTEVVKLKKKIKEMTTMKVNMVVTLGNDRLNCHYEEKPRQWQCRQYPALEPEGGHMIAGCISAKVYIYILYVVTACLYNSIILIKL